MERAQFKAYFLQYVCVITACFVFFALSSGKENWQYFSVVEPPFFMALIRLSAVDSQQPLPLVKFNQSDFLSQELELGKSHLRTEGHPDNKDSKDTAHYFLLMRVPDVTCLLPSEGLDTLFFLRFCETLNILLRNQVLSLQLP